MEKSSNNNEVNAASWLAEWHRRSQKASSRRLGAGSPVLIGVGKFHPPDHIAPFLNAGLADLGENYVQEAAPKFAALKARGHRFTAHLIGPLQSNKASDAAALFDVIHSVDRPKIAQALARACDALGKTLEIFLQVNIGRETQKAGVSIEALPALIAEVRTLPELTLRGLMAVPPDGVPPAPYFALLAEQARRHGLSGLSMGMSGDFETAIALGATHVRIGTALFGPRPS